jgi:ubiquinone/menaquinone biosynthesis C-methylase UbiE
VKTQIWIALCVYVLAAIIKKELGFEISLYTFLQILSVRPFEKNNFLVSNAEAIPVADANCDAVTSIFVFHELPPAVRRTVFRECARILKPGGRFVLLDSLQLGDRPDYDGLLELFPQSYHEPYYSTYISENFEDIAEASGYAMSLPSSLR